MGKRDLEDLLARRVDLYFKQQYGIQNGPKLRDLFTNNKAIDHILDRTMLRPRDAIMFFNDCMAVAIGKSKIGKTELDNAEKAYSEGRITSLREEWVSDYPNLKSLIYLIKRFPKNFRFEYFVQHKRDIETTLLEIKQTIGFIKCGLSPTSDFIRRGRDRHKKYQL